ncbi:MAG: hypothetical protein ABSF26_01480 [Thermoguttaceae bacterium]
MSAEPLQGFRRGILSLAVLLGLTGGIPAAGAAVVEEPPAPPTRDDRPDAAAPHASQGAAAPVAAHAVGQAPAPDGTASGGGQQGPLLPIPDPKNAGPVELEVTGLHGVTPGLSTQEAVEKAWGKPKESRREGNVLMQLYSVAPFSRVEVSYVSDKVASILVRFDRGFPAGQVAEQLDLIKVQPVLVSNAYGEILGQAYPERGVLLAFEAGQAPGKAVKKVTHIVLQPIEAEPFMLRAETNLDQRPEFSLHDLDQALKLAPTHARAHWLRARALLALGDEAGAVTSASEAVRLDPKDGWYRVTKARALAQCGRGPEAVAEAEKAVELSASRPHVKARGLCLLGDLKASAAKPDYHQALQFHAQAIQAAASLASSRHPAVRVAAKEVLLDAHLGSAHDIAWGDWREKEAAVQHWLEKAITIADDLVKNENSSEECRFRLSSRALAIQVGLQGKLDPGPWARETVRSGDSLIAATPETARKMQLQWEMALALYDALQACQMRSDPDSALRYGQLAVRYLEQSGRQDRAATNSYLLGRLYFRLGAICVLGHNDHAAAVVWFEKAVLLLGKSPPPEARQDMGRLGDTFVSMGVSYWAAGRREKALALTQHGAKLIEEAVHRGTYERAALAVPYANLATMHRSLGDRQQADRMEEMASQIKGTKTR